METKIKVSKNSRGRNKANVRYLTYNWVNGWATPEELANWVSQGYAWCGTHFSSGKRCEANASGSNAIVFDFDGEITVAEFWTTKTAQDWCCLTYTSASSTPECERFRAVFPLEGIPLTTSWEHRCVYQWIELQLTRALGIPFKDSCGQKPERLWFGNDQAQVHLNTEAFVPQAVVQAIEIPPEPAFGNAGMGGITDVDVCRCIWLLNNLIAPSEDEFYNEQYIPVTAACAAIGSQIADAWIDWVSRGHHGSKPSNMDPSLKWNGLGQRSGPASLYAIAKRQDPNWTRRLPKELWFGSQIDSGMDFDSILSQTINCAPRRLFR